MQTVILAAAFFYIWTGWTYLATREATWTLRGNPQPLAFRTGGKSSSDSGILDAFSSQVDRPATASTLTRKDPRKDSIRHLQQPTPQPTRPAARPILVSPSPLPMPTSSPVSAPSPAPNTPLGHEVKALTLQWAERINGKACAGEPQGATFFLFHMRKAAGTTLRDFLVQRCARRNHVPHRELLSRGGPAEGCLFESEGVTLDPAFFRLADAESRMRPVVTVTSLRDPVARIFSLYWYEHVGWWDGIVHEPAKIKRMDKWLDHWQDGSPWKQKFARENPGSTYVEPANYFVKNLAMNLAGDIGGSATRAHLVEAKARLALFDVVLLTERLGEPDHLAPVKLLLGTDYLGGSGSGGGEAHGSAHALKADAEPKKRLGRLLVGGAPGGEAGLRERVAEMNALDLELLHFAAALCAGRTKHALRELKQGAPQVHSMRCGAPPAGSRFPGHLRSKLGIHRPPGHKQ